MDAPNDPILNLHWLAANAKVEEEGDKGRGGSQTDHVLVIAVIEPLRDRLNEATW
ncbi:hypothetical protein TRIP_B120036 [uncultured Desulfatiglans sp.]|uniref:Uncharacterized protein n=1 Tax=Uncultured Desulfatiglans sp. TaxID=1748965 RepID=A0A653A0P5_UNCDX|nr:hypothetical protein TRIP_B120036 [uncultured Desulfatiglans sp.]